MATQTPREVILALLAASGPQTFHALATECETQQCGYLSEVWARARQQIRSIVDAMIENGELVYHEEDAAYDLP